MKTEKKIQKMTDKYLKAQGEMMSAKYELLALMKECQEKTAEIEKLVGKVPPAPFL